MNADYGSVFWKMWRLSQTNIIVFFVASQYWFIRLLSSARVGGRHNGQNPDEDVDCVHVYSNRPAEKHIFFFQFYFCFDHRFQNQLLF